jgi:hypothetical protein
MPRKLWSRRKPISELASKFQQSYKKTPSTQPFQPHNLAFHNLCKNNKLPLGSKELLGLNLKFCLTSNKITDGINKTVLQMAKNIRTKTYLKENNLLNNSEYLKQIYKKNLSWNPPPASSIIEEKITEFEKALKALLPKSPQKTRNLSTVELKPPPMVSPTTIKTK